MWFTLLSSHPKDTHSLFYCTDKNVYLFMSHKWIQHYFMAGLCRIHTCADNWEKLWGACLFKCSSVAVSQWSHVMQAWFPVVYEQSYQQSAMINTTDRGRMNCKADLFPWCLKQSVSLILNWSNWICRNPNWWILNIKSVSLTVRVQINPLTSAVSLLIGKFWLWILHIIRSQEQVITLAED